MYHIEILKRKNSRKYSVEQSFESMEEVIEYVQKDNLKDVEYPYMFTHIKLPNGKIITQDYNGIICSPVKLREAIESLK